MTPFQFYPCASCDRHFPEHGEAPPHKCLFGPGNWTELPEYERLTVEMMRRAFHHSQALQRPLLDEYGTWMASPKSLERTAEMTRLQATLTHLQGQVQVLLHGLPRMSQRPRRTSTSKSTRMR